MQVRRVADIAANALSVPLDVINSLWVSYRYEEWAAAGYQKALRRYFSVKMPATINTGTVSVTQGSAVVTPDSDALAVLTPDVVGRWIRVETFWYEVGNFDGATITLTMDYVEDTNSSASYNIADRRIKLDKSVRKIGAIVDPLLGNALVARGSEAADRAAPTRSDVASGPSVWIDQGYHDDGSPQVELYPYTSDDRMILYTGYVAPTELGPNDQLPNYVEPAHIVEGVKLSIMEREMSKAYQAGNHELGNSWGNQAARQRTIWNRIIEKISLSAQQVSDATFLLSMLQAPKAVGEGDIKTAQDQVLSRWNSLT
jgi:hypothetical protein